MAISKDTQKLYHKRSQHYSWTKYVVIGTVSKEKEAVSVGSQKDVIP